MSAMICLCVSVCVMPFLFNEPHWNKYVVVKGIFIQLFTLSLIADGQQHTQLLPHFDTVTTLLVFSLNLAL